MVTTEAAAVNPDLAANGALVRGKCSRGQRRREERALRAPLKDLLAYARQCFGLFDALESVPDGRKAGRVSIPLPAVMLAVMCMFWLNLGSMKALDDRLWQSAGLRRLLRFAGWAGSISDDTFADALQALDWAKLRSVLHAMGRRALSRWSTGPHLESELGQRLKGIGASWLAARPVVAIDGHELFCSFHRHCDDCLEREVTRELRDGTKAKVKQYYHRVVVAQWIGVHPSPILDVEPQLPGENELQAAYRLLERLGDVYGKRLGVIVADALYDCEPVRMRVRKAGCHFVIRHKDERREPGRTAGRQLDRRDPRRERPDRMYVESQSGRRYTLWVEEVPEGERRYVEVKRTVKVAGRTEEQHAALVTDLPADRAPLAAVAMIYEGRWWVENTGFHQLVTAWSLDRPFVHVGRKTAARAIVILALMAFNAFQAFVYRYLGWPPGALPRALRHLRMDFLELLALPERGSRARAP